MTSCTGCVRSDQHPKSSARRLRSCGAGPRNISRLTRFGNRRAAPSASSSSEGMSKYLAYPQVVFKSRDLLLAALAELGLTQIEEGEALALYGYMGDPRPEVAALVIRRQHLSSASH